VKAREMRPISVSAAACDPRRQQGAQVRRKAHPRRLGVGQLLSGDGPGVPFGGYKMKRLRARVRHQHVEEYLNVKAVWIKTA